jgi:soluble lytic murein transglycosylase-like protein
MWRQARRDDFVRAFISRFASTRIHSASERPAIFATLRQRANVSRCSLIWYVVSRASPVLGLPIEPQCTCENPLAQDACCTYDAEMPVASLLQAALLLCASAASAQPGLETALLAQMRLPNGHYVAHCRRARGGCEDRVARLAVALINAASREGVDAYLLAAIAFHESALNADAVGAAGERTIMQLHPNSRHGMEAARQCRRAPRECEAISIEIAAHLLAAAIARCGSEAAALGAYNRGVCGETSYSRAVLRLREEMRR